MRFDHSTASSFGESTFSEFLTNGCLLGADPDHFFVSWGEPDLNATASWFAPDFYLQARDPKLKAGGKWAVVHRSIFASLVLDLLRREVNGDLPAEHQGFRWVEPDLNGFKRQFAEIRNGFEKRALNKAVPVVFAQARETVTVSRLLEILANLVRLPGNLYPYGFWRSGAMGHLVEGMVGASPEILFSAESGFLKTVALAGTRAKPEKSELVSQEAFNLLNDPKERHEHQLVIDDIVAVLSKRGKVKVGETKTVELPTLYHLKTEIEAEIPELEFSDLMKALHPTPALGVSPRSHGFEEMHRWDDPSLRLRYGAPFGIEVPGKFAHCLVAIRNIQWQNDQIILGSGCGVVPASDVDREWAELKLKRDSVRRMLGV